MTDEPFDDVDRALAHGLSALAPEVDGGDETLAALRPRFRRARTRRRVAGVGVSLVALAAIGSVAVLAAPDSGRAHVQVSGRPRRAGRSSTTTSSTSVSTHDPARRVAAVDARPRPPAFLEPVRPRRTRRARSGGASPSPTTVPDHGPEQRPRRPGSVGRRRAATGHGGSRPPRRRAARRPEVQTYRSAGGSVTVRFADGQLELLSTSRGERLPRVGGQRRQPDDVDVRFDADQGRVAWRIRVRVDHDGHLTDEVTQS